MVFRGFYKKGVGELLNIGGDVEIPLRKLVMLLKYDAQQYKITGKFLKQNQACTIKITEKPPKSVLILTESSPRRRLRDEKPTITIYLSPLSPVTLHKRIERLMDHYTGIKEFL